MRTENRGPFCRSGDKSQTRRENGFRNLTLRFLLVLNQVLRTQSFYPPSKFEPRPAILAAAEMRCGSSGCDEDGREVRASRHHPMREGSTTMSLNGKSLWTEAARQGCTHWKSYSGQDGLFGGADC